MLRYLQPWSRLHILSFVSFPKVEEGTKRKFCANFQNKKSNIRPISIDLNRVEFYSNPFFSFGVIQTDKNSNKISGLILTAIKINLIFSSLQYPLYPCCYFYLILLFTKPTRQYVVIMSLRITSTGNKMHKNVFTKAKKVDIRITKIHFLFYVLLLSLVKGIFLSI